MTLIDSDIKRLEYLLGKQRVNHLLPAEEHELRQLVSSENPDLRNLEWDKVVQFGLVLVGTYLLIKAISDDA